MQHIEISELLHNPDYYLFGFENEDALVLHMNRASYAQSIFFDDRIVTVNDDLIRVPWETLFAAVAQMRVSSPRIGWIFHMAHTGSTLLARALDRSGKTLVIREPVTLRALGVEAAASLEGSPQSPRWRELLQLAIAMLGRRYSDEQTVLVKANVPVNGIIPDILARSESPLALLLHFGLEDYLVAILRAPNHRKWVENIFAELRLGELNKGRLPDALQTAEKAAALWLFQARIYADILAANPGVRSLDANILFDEPLLCLKAASEYFRCPMSEEDVRGIVSGELFSTYSKNPNAPFDNARRKARVVETRSALAGEIIVARRWLEPSLAILPLPDRLARPLCGENSYLL